MIDREEAIKRLRECQQNDDIEIRHIEADEILCELLTSLGYSDVVQEWNNLDKWYA